MKTNDWASERKCPDCKGAGSFALLVSVKICPRCDGTGRIAPSPVSAAADWDVDSPPMTAQPPTVYREFDALGRIVYEARAGASTIIVMSYDSSGRRIVDQGARHREC